MFWVILCQAVYGTIPWVTWMVGGGGGGKPGCPDKVKSFHVRPMARLPLDESTEAEVTDGKWSWRLVKLFVPWLHNTCNPSSRVLLHPHAWRPTAGSCQGQSWVPHTNLHIPDIILLLFLPIHCFCICSYSLNSELEAKMDTLFTVTDALKYLPWCTDVLVFVNLWRSMLILWAVLFPHTFRTGDLSLTPVLCMGSLHALLESPGRCVSQKHSANSASDLYSWNHATEWAHPCSC